MTKLVFCADDFTGASDTLATLARAGLSARLYLNAPDMSDHKNDDGHGSSGSDPDSLDAFGVATSLRAMGSKTALPPSANLPVSWQKPIAASIISRSARPLTVRPKPAISPLLPIAMRNRSGHAGRQSLAGSRHSDVIAFWAICLPPWDRGKSIASTAIR